MNGYTNTMNGHLPNGDSKFKIASKEMCVYCFEVLQSELNRQDVHVEPQFTNQA